MTTGQTNLRGRSIEKELFIKATPERVFPALIEKEYLERWFVTKADIDFRPGGRIRFDWARGSGIFNFGKILVLEPPRRLSYTWEAQSPDVTTVTFELKAENAGTHLRLLHSGIGEGEDWDRYYNSRNGGWDVHLSNLVAWLETGQKKNW